jgi:hypothetical protein
MKHDTNLEIAKRLWGTEMQHDGSRAENNQGFYK